MSARVALLENLARAVPVNPGRPVRVAIDGMTGVGKSTFRGELAMALIAAGRQVLEASGDDFHHVRDHRYEQGKSSPVGYFDDAYDYEAMALKLFKPLEPGGD